MGQIVIKNKALAILSVIFIPYCDISEVLLAANTQLSFSSSLHHRPSAQVNPTLHYLLEKQSNKLQRADIQKMLTGHLS